MWKRTQFWPDSSFAPWNGVLEAWHAQKWLDFCMFDRYRENVEWNGRLGDQKWSSKFQAYDFWSTKGWKDQHNVCTGPSPDRIYTPWAWGMLQYWSTMDPERVGVRVESALASRSGGHSVFCVCTGPFHLSVFLYTRLELIYGKFYGYFTEKLAHAQCVPGPFTSPPQRAWGQG